MLQKSFKLKKTPQRWEKCVPLYKYALKCTKSVPLKPQLSLLTPCPIVANSGLFSAKGKSAQSHLLIYTAKWWWPRGANKKNRLLQFMRSGRSVEPEKPAVFSLFWRYGSGRRGALVGSWGNCKHDHLTTALHNSRPEFHPATSTMSLLRRCQFSIIKEEKLLPSF